MPPIGDDSTSIQYAVQWPNVTDPTLTAEKLFASLTSEDGARSFAIKQSLFYKDVVHTIIDRFDDDAVIDTYTNGELDA